MIEFETYSGSVYQIDAERLLVRRLSGTHEPTPSQGSDGEWKAYASISGVNVGLSTVVFWGRGSARYTQTSRVTAVREVDAVDS